MSCYKYTSPHTGKVIIKDTIDEIYQYILENEKQFISGYRSQLLPAKYVDEDGNAKMNELEDFFANDYINSMHYMTLLYGDLAMTHKGPVDVVKRNGNLISAGEVLGSTVTKTAIIKAKEIDFKDKYPDGHPILDNNEKTDQDIQDAQTYSSIHWYMQKYLPSLAKMPASVRKIYNKIRAGFPVTEDEFETLSIHSATMPDRKIVVRDHFRLIKTSAHIQTREKTSYIKNGYNAEELSIITALWSAYDQAQSEEERLEILNQIHERYNPIKGMEYHHEMLNEMERQQIGLVSVDSSSKNASMDIGRFNDETQRFEFAPQIIPDNAIREQVKTDTIKKEIVHGTQLQGLIWSEQDGSTIVKVDGIENGVPLSEIRDAYIELLSDRIVKGFNQKREEIFNEDGTVKYDKIWSKIEAALIGSNPDPYLLELFKLDDNGKPAYSWNLSILHKKLQNIFMSYMSKNALSHKVPGTTFTLVSSEGHNVIEDSETGRIINRDEYLSNPAKFDKPRYKTRPLKFAEFDEEKGIYYSECIVPRSILKRYGLKKGDSVPHDLQFMVGTRIPTQDKHSMTVLKIVDVLPDMYETSIIFPPELIFLSGADFDIDKIFARTYASYGSGNIYGKYLTDSNPIETAWKEYTASNGRDMEIVEFNKKYGERVKSNIKAYKEGKLSALKPITREETNNLLLELEMRLVMNDGNMDKATTKASLDLLKSKDSINSVLNYMRELNMITEEQATGVASAIDKAMAQHNNDVGKSGIGPAALFNVLFQKLVQGGIVSKDIISENEEGEKTVTEGGFFGYKNFNRLEANGFRINDIISTVISAMTDNAKERLAAMYNLSTNTEGPFLAMIGAGMKPHLAALIIKQEAISLFEQEMNNKKRPVKLKRETKQTIEGVDRKGLLEEIEGDLIVKYDLSPDSINLGWIENDLESALVRNAKGELSKSQIGELQVYIIREFAKANNHSNKFMAMSRLSSLIKGFKATFEEDASFESALNELNIEVSISNTVREAVDQFEVHQDPSGEYYALFKDGPTTLMLRFTEGENYDKDHLQLLPLINKDKQQFSQIAAFFVKQYDAKKIFIRQSDTFNDLLQEFYGIIKDNILLYGDNVGKLKESLLTYLNMRAFRHLTGTQIDLGLPFRKVSKDQALIDHLITDLRSEESPYSNNSLLKYINVEGGFEYKSDNNPFKGLTLFRVLGNTRTQLDPDFKSALVDDYFTLLYAGKIVPGQELKDMSWDNKATLLAVKLREYILLMDNMQFKNAGLIKSLHPEIFNSYSAALRLIEDLFKGEKVSSYKGEQIKLSFEKVFGVSRNKLMDEFLELYALNQGYQSNLNFVSSGLVNKGFKDIDIKDRPTFMNADGLIFNIFAGQDPDNFSKEIAKQNELAFIRTRIATKVNGLNYKFARYVKTKAGKADKKEIEQIMRLTTIRVKENDTNYEYRLEDGFVFRYEQDPSTKKYTHNQTRVETMPDVGRYAKFTPIDTILPKHFVGFAHTPDEVRQFIADLKEVEEDTEEKSDNTQSLTDEEIRAKVLEAGKALSEKLKTSTKTEENTESAPVEETVQKKTPEELLREKVLKAGREFGKNKKQIQSPVEFINALYAEFGKNGAIISGQYNVVRDLVDDYNNNLGWKAITLYYKDGKYRLWTNDDAINVRSTLSQDSALAILQNLSLKFGIPYEIDNSMKSKGEFVNGVVRINMSKMTDDTPFHEFAHPFIQAVKQSNSRLYNNLVNEIKKEGKILERTAKRYRAYFESKKNMSSSKIDDAIIEEAIVQALGEYAADFNKVKEKSKGLFEAIKKFLKEVAQVLKNILGRDKITVDEIDPSMTLRELSILLNSDVNIDLNTEKGNFADEIDIVLQQLDQNCK